MARTLLNSFRADGRYPLILKINSFRSPNPAWKETVFFGLLGRSLDYVNHWYEPETLKMRAVVKTKCWSIDA